MKTLIIYASLGGCTERAVRELSQQLSGEVLSIDLKRQQLPPLREFDRIVIGYSIVRGRINPEIHRFYIEQKQNLADKEIGLFVCCSKDEHGAREIIKNAFPEGLRQMAKTEAIFRMTINLKEMSMVKRILVKRVPRVLDNLADPDYESISHFANRMERTWSPFMFLV